MEKLILCIVIVVLLHLDGVLSRNKDIIVLNEENWRDALKGEWMIKFYAPWCPACKANEGDYAAFAEWSDDLNIKVAIVDITKEPGLSGRFMVTALPTFYHAYDGEFRRYSNARSSDAMYDFIQSKTYRTLESIWWVRHPDSILMTMMSWLFKTSVIMKDLHEAMTETYGLSTWLSYALFGVATLVVGLTLGVILVCVVEFVSPSKNKASIQSDSSNSTVKEKKSESSKEQDRAERFLKKPGKPMESEGEVTPGTTEVRHRKGPQISHTKGESNGKE